MDGGGRGGCYIRPRGLVCRGHTGESFALEAQNGHLWGEGGYGRGLDADPLHRSDAYLEGQRG